jgi:hypothetical protein
MAVFAQRGAAGLTPYKAPAGGLKTHTSKHFAGANIDYIIFLAYLIFISG